LTLDLSGVATATLSDPFAKSRQTAGAWEISCAPAVPRETVYSGMTSNDGCDGEEDAQEFSAANRIVLAGGLLGSSVGPGSGAAS